MAIVPSVQKNKKEQNKQNMGITADALLIKKGNQKRKN